MFPLRTGKRWARRLVSGSLLIIALGACVENGNESAAEAPQGEVSEDAFHDDLAPYGRWIFADEYGWVWVPSTDQVGADFVPYASGGSWVYTDWGWMFVSNYPWGWATFHYGRWFYAPSYGWVWVPGRVWAPAWVDWRFGVGLIGWAPLPPHGRHRSRWVFVPADRFTDRHVRPYVFPPERTPALVHATQPVHAVVRVGGATWYRGPSVGRVEQAGPAPVRRVRLKPPRPGVIVRVHVVGGAARAAPPPNRPPGGFPRHRGRPRVYRAPARPGGGHVPARPGGRHHR